MYLAKELIEVTISKMEQGINDGVKKEGDDLRIESFGTAIERLEMIKERILNRFLERSDFENVNGVFDIFRI